MPNDKKKDDDKKQKEKEQKEKERMRMKQQKLMADFNVTCDKHDDTVAEEERKILAAAKKPGFIDQLKERPLDLHSAAMEGDILELINLLKKGFSVDALDEQMNTPLFYACENGNFKTSVILIENRANVNHASKHGYTPLMFAAWKGRVDIVTLLIKHGADVNARNKNNDTALHFAALCGFSMVCLLLRRAGADTGVKNNNKKTPLDNGGVFKQEFEVTMVVKLPKDPIDFQTSKSMFGIKQVVRELSKFVQNTTDIL